jgi:uncharacterized membrane protein
MIGKAEKNMSIIYRISVWLSLSLIVIATFEFIISGQHHIISKEIQINKIIFYILKGDFYSTYMLAIIILIFSPVVSLFFMLISYLTEKKWKLAFLILILIIIMTVGAFFKT